MALLHPLPTWASNAAEKAGISFAVPQKWSVIPRQEGGDASVGVEPPSYSQAHGDIVITLYLVKKGLSELTAERQQDWIYYDGYRVLDTACHNIGASHNIAAIDRTIEYSLGDNYNYRVRFLYFGQPGRIYCVRLFSDLNSFSKLNNEFERISNSLRVLPQFSVNAIQNARAAYLRKLPRDGKQALSAREIDKLWPAADTPAKVDWLNTSEALKIFDGANATLKHNAGLASTVVAAAYLRRALAFSTLGKWKESKADLDAATKLRPADASVYKVCAIVQSMFKNKTGALDAANSALALAPSDPQCHTAKALGYFCGVSTNAAIDEATAAIKLQRNAAMAYALRGMAAYRLGDNQSIENDFLQAAKLEPQSSLFHYMAGRYFMEVNKLPRALSEFDAAIKFDPQSNMAYYFRAVVLDKMKEYGKAKNDLTQSILLSGNYEPAYSMRALVELKQGDLDSCLADCMQADKYSAYDPLVYLTRTEALLKLNKNELALKEINRMIRKFPNRPDPFKLRARIHQAMGRPDLASDDLNECMQVEATDRFAGHGKVALTKYLERFQGLIKSYDQVLALNVKDGDAHYNRAVAYLCLGKFAQAADDFRQFLQITNWQGAAAGNAAILLNFAYRLDHKEKEAGAVVTEALANIKNHGFPYPILHFLKGNLSEGDAFLTANDRDQAFSALTYLGIGQALNGQYPEADWDLNRVRDQGDAKSDEYYLALSALDRLNRQKAQAGRSNR